MMRSEKFVETCGSYDYSEDAITTTFSPTPRMHEDQAPQAKSMPHNGFCKAHLTQASAPKPKNRVQAVCTRGASPKLHRAMVPQG